MLRRRIEIVPTSGIVRQVRDYLLPEETSLTVTSLPKHGVEPTARTAVQLAELGFNVVPHISARQIASRSELLRILRGYAAAGISEVFAIGGDQARPAGPYASSAELLHEIRETFQYTFSVGIAGCPEAHSAAARASMILSLQLRQSEASYVVTQMCFSAAAIADFVQDLRSEGVTLPVWAGLAGPVSRTRLLSVASKIGVGTSLRFISGKSRTVARLLSGDRYSPTPLVEELTALSRDTIAGIHLYTFNDLAGVEQV